MVHEQQILRDDQTTSIEVSDLSGITHITLTDFQEGEKWVVQRKSPNGENWIDLDVTFEAEGSKVFYAVPGITYRITGGTVGATCWVVSVPQHSVVQPDHTVIDRDRAVPLL